MNINDPSSKLFMRSWLRDEKSNWKVWWRNFWYILFSELDEDIKNGRGFATSPTLPASSKGPNRSKIAQSRSTGTSAGWHCPCPEWRYLGLFALCFVTHGLHLKEKNRKYFREANFPTRIWATWHEMHWEQKNTGVEISGECQSVSPDTLAIFLKKKQRAKKK